MTVVPLGRLLPAGREPTAPIALRDDTRVLFGQFAADVAHAADLARKAAVRRGAVLSDDPYRFLTGLFGLLHAGATVVVPPDARPETLTSLGDRCDAVLGDESSPGRVTVLPLHGGMAGATGLDAIDGDAATLEFFTSGSTGSAKCIVKSLTMLDREIATLDSLWGRTVGQHPVFSTVPFRHIFGLSFHLLWPLAGSRPFMSHVDELLEPLLTRNVSGATLVTSPAHLTRLTGLAPLPPGRRPARIFTAGAPLRSDQARDVAAVLGVLPTEIFGSTETGAIATRIQQTDHEPWAPLPGIKVLADAAGCMIVRSPYGPDAEPFLSADRIELVPDGRFHFLGRLDRIAKIEGKRVSLVALEQALVDLPVVVDAAAVVLGGSPERLAAAIVLKPVGRDRLAALGSFRFSRELRRQLSQRFESAWLPKSWRFVDELPLGAMGKRRDVDVKALFVRKPGRPA